MPSAIFGNPATLAQFQGTQFTIGGGWVEGYPTFTNDGLNNQLDPGTPFSGTSRTEGFLGRRLASHRTCTRWATTERSASAFPARAVGGAEYRGMVPQNPMINNSSSEYLVLGVNIGAGFQLTDRLALGAAITLGNAFEELGNVGPFTSSAMVNAYGLRGTIGSTYELNDCNTFGFYYQSKMNFTFQDAVRVGANFQDVKVDQPNTLGFGLANRSLMDGNLLLAGDVYYKLWDDAYLWQDVLVDQWAIASGAQYTAGSMKYRVGYSYNSDPINHNVGSQLDNLPVLQSELQLYQAANLAAGEPAPHHGRHRSPRRLLPRAGHRPLRRRTAAADGSVRRHNSASLCSTMLAWASRGATSRRRRQSDGIFSQAHLPPR